jgi:hypothetical protein
VTERFVRAEIKANYLVLRNSVTQQIKALGGGSFVERPLPLVVLSFALAAIFGAASVRYAQGTKVAGYWSGTTRVTPCVFSSSGRCNAVNNITLSLEQQSDRIEGKYTCAYANLNCRNAGADDTGKIVSGRISGNEIRLSPGAGVGGLTGFSIHNSVLVTTEIGV